MGKFLPSGPDIPLRRRRRAGTAEIYFSSKWGFVIRARRKGWAGGQERATRPYREWMKFANVAWKYLPGELKASYLRFGAITGYPARDIFFSLLSGNLFQLEFPDGRVVYGMGYLDRVSRNLDAISQRRGALLRRGEELWEEIPPGLEGSFVRMVGGKPTWVLGGGAGGGVYLIYPPLISGIYGGGVDDWSTGIRLAKLGNTNHYFGQMIPPPQDQTVTANYQTWILFESGGGDIVLEAQVRCWTPENGWVAIGGEQRIVSGTAQQGWLEILFRFPIEIPENPRIFLFRFQRWGEKPQDTYGGTVRTPCGFFWYSPQTE